MLPGDQLYVLEKFDAARIVDVIERHRITTFTATPTMLQRIADLSDVDDRDLSSLEWILQGAAPMPPSLVHRWRSEEHTSELQSLMRLPYDVFCLQKRTSQTRTCKTTKQK